MALYFAEIGINDRVLRVIVVNDIHAPNGAAWCQSVYGGNWLETKLDGSVRGIYTGIGWRYNPIADTFIAKTVAQATVTVLGDSIAQQMSSSLGSLPVPLNGASLLGVSGNTAAQVATRVGNVSGSATHVVIQAGTNDLFGLNNESGIIPAYIAMLNALTPTKRVLVTGILPPDHVQLAATWGAENAALLSPERVALVNAQITSLCSSYQNCSAVTAAMSLDMTGKTTDGIHLTTAGYQAWSNTMLSLI